MIMILNESSLKLDQLLLSHVITVATHIQQAFQIIATKFINSNNLPLLHYIEIGTIL